MSWRNRGLIVPEKSQPHSEVLGVRTSIYEFLGGEVGFTIQLITDIKYMLLIINLLK